MADGDTQVRDAQLDARLDTVRKGYDPTQVRRLVGALSNELKSLDEENTALRREFETSRVTSTLVSSRATSDIVTSWTRETNEMLESARQQVGRIMDKANADAAAVVTAA